MSDNQNATAAEFNSQARVAHFMINGIYNKIRNTALAPPAAELYAATLPHIGEVTQLNCAGESVTIACRDGMGDHLDREIVKGEQPVLQELIDSVSRNDVFWDVGGHLGVYSSFVGQRVDQVVAFEPNTSRRAILKRNLKKNNVEGIVRSDFLGDGSSDSVTTDSLDLPTPTMMKMDIEGGELAALKGMRELLQKVGLQLLFVELHPASAVGSWGLSEAECNTVRTLLRSAGFTVSDVGQRGGQSFIRAKKD